MAFMKHVGKHGDRKVCILFRQVPGEDHMCLVIYPEVMPAHWQDSIQKALESEVAQQSEELADALHRSFLPDGRAVLATLHQERMIKKLRTADVIVTPTPTATIRLDELNKMLNEMKTGEAAIKKMAENDASRGLVAPEVKRKAEAEFKASQVAKGEAVASMVPPLRAGQDGALSDREADLLRESASRIGAWEVKDKKTGVGVGLYNIDEASFKRELTRINELAKKALQRAGGGTSVGGNNLRTKYNY
jgi:hypothetical protein